MKQNRRHNFDCWFVQASRQGIWVANIPSSMTANAVSCAEHAIYLMIALLRQQKEMQRSIEVSDIADGL